MFDRASIVSGLCRRWIQQGQLSEREWLRLQELHRSSKQDLEELLLGSSYINETMLLEGLAEELGCRFWRGRMLMREMGGTLPPSLPIAIDFFAHKQIAPLSWDATGGVLHLVMSRLPTNELLVELKSLLPIAKLHLELASQEAILLVLGQWTQQSSKITMMHKAAGDAVALATLLDEEPTAQGDVDKTQPIQALSLPPQETQANIDPITDSSTIAPTVNAAAFEAPTVRQPPKGTAAFGHFSKPGTEAGGDANATYTVLPVVSLDSTVGALAPAPFPGQVDQAMGTMEKPPPPTFPGTRQRDSSATHAWSGVASQVLAENELINENIPQQRLPTGDLRESGGLEVDDSDFFLDYQSPSTPAPPSFLDEDGEPALPTAMGADDPLSALGSDWALQASPGRVDTTTPFPQPAVQPVLDLLEEVEGETPPPTPAPVVEQTRATPVPQEPQPQASVLAPGAPILPSDDELFGGALRPAPLPRQHQASPPKRAAGIAPAPKINPTQPRHSSPKQKKKPKKGAEEFLLRYVLGGAVGLVNIAIRVGVVAMIGYLVWYLFLKG